MDLAVGEQLKWHPSQLNPNPEIQLEPHHLLSKQMLLIHSP